MDPSSNSCKNTANAGSVKSSNDSVLKPCCACPETRKLRDECVFLNGEEACVEFIEKHKECLKSYGFII